jgi:hypothetical protein
MRYQMEPRVTARMMTHRPQLPRPIYLDSFSALALVGLRRLRGILEDRLHGGLEHAELHVVRDLDLHFLVGDQEDATDDPALGHHQVALLEVGEEGPVFLQLLLLRPDHEEVHDREHPGDEDEERRWASAGRLGQEDLMGEQGDRLRQGLSKQGIVRGRASLARGRTGRQGASLPG